MYIFLHNIQFIKIVIKQNTRSSCWNGQTKRVEKQKQNKTIKWCDKYAMWKHYIDWQITFVLWMLRFCHLTKRLRWQSVRYRIYFHSSIFTNLYPPVWRYFTVIVMFRSLTKKWVMNDHFTLDSGNWHLIKLIAEN